MSARELMAKRICTGVTIKGSKACEVACLGCLEDADADIAALSAAGYEIRKPPQTIQELQAEVGTLQSRLHFLVLGDPTKCVSFPAANPKEQGQ